jgi:hypothetical protein
MQLNTTIIKFPEIKLRTRDGHKLRGFFGNLFKEKSELLHNHFADGSPKYHYPLVQYKVIDNIPHLIGINEGGKLLMELFLKIEFIDIENVKYEINSKNITNKITEIGDFSTLNEYKFGTLWMGLNQHNYEIYSQIKSQNDKNVFLNKQIQNNILSFYKGIDYRVEEKIMAISKLKEKTTKFKDKYMLAFAGSFVTNAILPDFVGLGKAVSRGFGTVVKS